MIISLHRRNDQFVGEGRMTRCISLNCSKNDIVHVLEKSWRQISWLTAEPFTGRSQSEYQQMILGYSLLLRYNITGYIQNGFQ